MYKTGDGSYEAAVDGKLAFTQVFGGEYKRTFTPAARKPRPSCVCCGKAYGRRDVETTREQVSGPPAPYRGNAFLVEEELHMWGVSSDEPKGMLARQTWDGESYVAPYSPFCTLRCALQFARQAYRSGWRATRATTSAA